MTAKIGSHQIQYLQQFHYSAWRGHPETEPDQTTVLPAKSDGDAMFCLQGY